VAPTPHELIREGGVLCRADRVVAVGRADGMDAAGAQRIDLGDALILPGFVNAHTHLELSALAGRLAPTCDFPGWICSLRAHVTRWSLDELRASILRGVREIAAAGVTGIGNITARPETDAALFVGHSRATDDYAFCDSGGRRIHWRCFCELLGLREEEAEGLLEKTLLRQSLIDSFWPRAAFGLAPHAPYSVSPKLLRRCFEVADAKQIAITIHAAETREEERFCLLGDGALFDMVREFGALPDEWRPPRKRPLEYLAEMGLGRSPALVAHANYANDDEIRWMAAHDISVAFCPTSHQFFDHAPYPLRQMLAAGVNVCVATDSLASSTTLDPLEAVRLAAPLCPELPAADWIAMITTNAARALNMKCEIAPSYEPRRLDSLDHGEGSQSRSSGENPGRNAGAGFNVFSLERSCNHPLDALLRGDARLLSPESWQT